MSTSAAHVSNSTRLGTVKLRVAARTDVGRRRTENQDSYGYVHTAETSLYIVADGMGGARGGGTASAMAVNLIVEGAVSSSGELSLESLQSAIDLSNKVIYARSQKDSQFTGMGTTVVAIAFLEGAAIIAHVGDSRGYLCREGQLQQLTRDHTLVQELVDTGAIPPQDAATHPIAHMLTRSLGPTEAIGVEIHSLPDQVRPGDKFLLCSDGLYNHVSSDEIRRVLSEKAPDDAASELIQLALDGGGSDNVTLQVIEVLNVHDTSVQGDRPAAGEIEKFVSSELDVSSFDGVTLNEYAKTLNGPISAPSSVPETSASEPAATNGAGRHGRDSADGSSAADDDSEKPTRRSQTVSFEAEEDRPHSALGGVFEEGASRAPDGEFTVSSESRPLGIIASLFALASLGAYIVYSFSHPPELPVTPQKAATSTSVPGPTAAVSSVPQQPAVEPAVETAKREMTEELATWDPSTKAPELPPDVAATAEPKVEVAANQGSHEHQANGSQRTAEEAEHVVASILSNSKDLESITAPEVQPEMDEPTAPEKRYADLILTASDIRVATAPRLSLGGASVRTSQPDQPIVWENESKLVQKILSGRPLPAATNPPAEAPKLRTPEELQELADQKAVLRDKIADIDAKLEMLVLETVEDARRKQVRLEMEASRNNEALVALQKELAFATDNQASWERLQQRSAEAEPLKLADEVAVLSEYVKAKRAEYSDTTEKYLSAVDKWQTGQREKDLESGMASLGRDVKTKRLELETAVSNALSSGLMLARTRVQRLRFDIANLQRYRDRMNRHIGLLRAFTADPLSRKQELQRKYLEDRSLQLKNLNQLRASLSDDDELEFRVANAELFSAAV